MRNEDRDKLNLRHLMNLTTSSTKEDSSLESSLARYSNCPLCTQCHPLYRSEVFESNPVAERRELVYRKGICFNRINCTKHLSKSCKSPIQCKVPGCGKSCHTLPEEILIIKQTTPKSQTCQPLQHPCRVSKMPPRAHAYCNCS